MDNKPTLLLHSCCAPCSSHVLELLHKDYQITVFFYNPNITDRKEYELRRDELRRLLNTPLLGGVNHSYESPLSFNFLEGPYTPDNFHDLCKGLESEPEGGGRCFRCYKLRLSETARTATEHGFDFFATTLTVSPHKNAARINDIGHRLVDIVIADDAVITGLTTSRRNEICNPLSVPTYLPSDFKQNGGYQRSIALSKQYALYRQNFCGCEFSRSML